MASNYLDYSNKSDNYLKTFNDNKYKEYGSNGVFLEFSNNGFFKDKKDNDEFITCSKCLEKNNFLKETKDDIFKKHEKCICKKSINNSEIVNNVAIMDSQIINSIKSKKIDYSIRKNRITSFTNYMSKDNNMFSKINEIVDNGFVFYNDEKIICHCCKIVLNTIDFISKSHKNCDFLKEKDYSIKINREKTFLSKNVKKFILDKKEDLTYCGFIYVKENIVKCHYCGLEIKVSVNDNIENFYHKECTYIESIKTPDIEESIKKIKECGFNIDDIDVLIEDIKNKKLPNLDFNSLLDHITLISKKSKKINPKDLDKLVEENNKIKEIFTCCICLDNPRCIMFQPCGHLITCYECSKKIRKCSLCRANIVNKMKVFMS